MISFYKLYTFFIKKKYIYKSAQLNGILIITLMSTTRLMHYNKKEKKNY